jgi:hypothetical protein
MRELNWYCPAVDREIGDNVCREYQCAGKQCGADETLRELERWLRMTHRYAGIDAFHKVCAECAHGKR